MCNSIFLHICTGLDSSLESNFNTFLSAAKQTNKKSICNYSPFPHDKPYFLALGTL